MRKYQIKCIQNIEDVHRYVIKKDLEIHGALCGLLLDLGMDRQEVLSQVDIIFDNLDNEFIFLSDSKTDVYIFIIKDYVNLVFKTKMKLDRLIKLLNNYFIFPK